MWNEFANWFWNTPITPIHIALMGLGSASPWLLAGLLLHIAEKRRNRRDLW